MGDVTRFALACLGLLAVIGGAQQCPALVRWAGHLTRGPSAKPDEAHMDADMVTVAAELRLRWWARLLLRTMTICPRLGRGDTLPRILRHHGWKVVLVDA